MYKSFFGLRSNPFNINPDPSFFFATRGTEEAFSCLTSGIRKRKGILLLTGEAGTGKTTLLRKVLEWLQEEGVPTAYVFNPRLSTLGFLEFVLSHFGVKFHPGPKLHMLLSLSEWLRERHQAGKTAVLVVDESQNLSLEVLEELRLLTNLETPTEKLLQIVLCGQPELEEKLGSAELRQLQQRITVRSRTHALTPEETRAYVAERLRIAGASGPPIFTPAAVESVHQFSGGVPGLINLLCEHALISAYADEQKPVAAETIQRIARQFELPLTEARAQHSAREGRGEGIRDHGVVFPRQAPISSARASQAWAMNGSLARKANPLEEAWEASREDTHENQQSVEPRAGARAKEPVPSGTARAWGSTDRQPGPSATSMAGGRATPLIAPRRVSGNRMGFLGLTLVVCALVGSWVVMRMTSEVHLQPTSDASTPPVASPSQSSEVRPPDVRTTPPEEVKVSTALDEMLPLSKVPGTDRKPSRAPKGESVMRTLPSPAPPSAPAERPTANRPTPHRELSAAQRNELKDKLVIAEFFMDRNDYDSALEAFEAARKIDPSSREARAGIERARRARDAQKASARP